MKKIITILFSFVFIINSCKKNDKKELATEVSAVQQNMQYNINDFLGDWEVENSTKDNGDTFSITLIKSKNNLLEGYYCAVAFSGNKIDCTINKEINIKTINADSNGYLVVFESFFGAKNGEARISLSNGKLHWQVTRKPKGEFYCPLNVILSKKIQKFNNNHNQLTPINISSKNYKGTDITMQLYKDIIENYGCGEYSVNGLSLGKQGDFEIFIVENECGDFPFKDLMSIKDGKIVDKLLIESSSFDIEELENQNIQDKSDISFEIENISKIKITSNHFINEKKESSIIVDYYLNKNGFFKKINN